MIAVDLFLDAVTAVIVAAGLFFMLAGAIGVLRLPDFYTRMHAAGMTDTLGAELVILGLMFQSGVSLMTLKLALIGLFLFLTSPTATHAVANAAYVAGVQPLLGRYRPARPEGGDDGEEPAS